MTAETTKRIARALVCEDCRLHRPEAGMHLQLCELAGVDDVYIGTEAGPDGAILNDEVRRPGAIRNGKIIKGAKTPDVDMLVGHCDCAGHPVTDEEHERDTIEAARQYSMELHGVPDKVIPVLAHQNPETGGWTWFFRRLDQHSVHRVAAE